MNKLFWIVFVLLVCVHCSKNNSFPDKPTSSKQAVPLDAHKDYLFSGNHEMSSFQITNVDIFDNRCPEGLSCFSAGWYGVTFLFTLNNIEKEVELCNWNCGDKWVGQSEVTFKIGDAECTIILIDILPASVPLDKNDPRRLNLEVIIKQ